jgi:hypothetical protein
METMPAPAEKQSAQHLLKDSMKKSIKTFLKKQLTECEYYGKLSMFETLYMRF